MTTTDPTVRAAEISFRQCRLFESVGRLTSVRRGSEECNLSQPAVTQALGKLEQQVGASLLERRASGSYLTESGKIFHLRVQRLFAQMEAALLDLWVGNPGIASTIANRLSRSQVRSLIAVVESGSLSQAAEDLNLTQASLQRAVRHLEGNLGRSIFHRTSTGVVVTPDGLNLARKLKLASQEIELGLQEIEDASGARSSRIVLGTLPYGGSMLLASVLDEFTKRHPDARVRVLTEGATEMMRRLQFGDVDLVVGLVQETTDANLVNETFAHTSFQIVARNGHPLARRKDVTLDDLASYDWISGQPGASRRQCLDNLFQGRALPRAPIETSTLPIIRQLIAESDRLTLMTSYELRHESHAVVAIPFGPIPSRPAVGITMRKDWLPTRIHRDFMDLIRTHLQRETLPLDSHVMH